MPSSPVCRLPGTLHQRVGNCTLHGQRRHVSHRVPLHSSKHASVNLATKATPSLVLPSSCLRKQLLGRHTSCLRAAATSEGATEPQAPTLTHWWKKDPQPNCRDVNGVQELVDCLADAGDRLVVVDFYATWCASCRALYPKLCRLMAEYPDVIFLKVNLEENKQMCKTLSVKVLPYFHFYKGAQGRIDTFSCSLAKVQKMKDALAIHSAPICSLSPIPGVQEFPDVIAHGSQLAGASITILPSADQLSTLPLATLPSSPPAAMAV